MAEDLEHILSQLSQPDNAVIQQVMSELSLLIAHIKEKVKFRE